MATKKAIIKDKKKAKKVDPFRSGCRLVKSLPEDCKIDVPGYLRGPSRAEWEIQSENAMKKGGLTTPYCWLLLGVYCYLWGVFVFYAAEIKLAQGPDRDMRKKQSGGGSSQRRLIRLQSAQRNCSKLLDLLRVELDIKTT